MTHKFEPYCSSLLLGVWLILVRVANDCIGKNKVTREDWESGHRRVRGSDQPLDNLGLNKSRDEDNDGSFHQYSDSESQSNSPTGMMGVLGANHSVGKCSGSSTTSSSFICGSSVGCCSGSTTEVEEGDDDGCLDDWEAVADALAANGKPPQNPLLGNVSDNENAVDPLSQAQLSTDSEYPGIEHVGHARVSSPTSKRAWRPDDTFSPLMSDTVAMGQYCGLTFPRHLIHAQYCYEDLDKTDSSFLPCLCGFVCAFSATRGSSRKTVIAWDVDILITATQWRPKFAWRQPDTAVGIILQHGNQDIRRLLLFCRIPVITGRLSILLCLESLPPCFPGAIGCHYGELDFSCFSLYESFS